MATIRREKWGIFSTSVFSILVPFSLGFGYALELSAAYLKLPENRLVFALFFATALSISAIPLVAKQMPLWMLGSDGIVGSCIEVTGNRGVFFFCSGAIDNFSRPRKTAGGKKRNKNGTHFDKRFP